MGVGLHLNGRFDPPAGDDPADAWLRRVADWFDDDLAGDEFWGNFLTRHSRGTTHDGAPALSVFVHPAGEDVEFSVPEPGRVTVSTKTSTVGPGYHTALCRLLHRFAEDFGVAWNPVGEEDDASHDETGYFFTGDRLGRRGGDALAPADDRRHLVGNAGGERPHAEGVVPGRSSTITPSTPAASAPRSASARTGGAGPSPRTRKPAATCTRGGATA